MAQRRNLIKSMLHKISREMKFDESILFGPAQMITAFDSAYYQYTNILIKVLAMKEFANLLQRFL